MVNSNVVCWKLMSKKQKKDQAVSKLPLRLIKHMKSMDNMSPDKYEQWCSKNSFVCKISKSTAELEIEVDFFKQNKDRKNKIKNMDKNLRRYIKDACDNKMDIHDVDRPNWNEFFKIILNSSRNKNDRESLKNLLLRVDHVTGFLSDSIDFGNKKYRYIAALVNINNHRNQWLRSIDKWTPKSHNSRKQFSIYGTVSFCQLFFTNIYGFGVV